MLIDMATCLRAPTQQYLSLLILWSFPHAATAQLLPSAPPVLHGLFASVHPWIKPLQAFTHAIVPNSLLHSVKSYPYLWEMVALCVTCSVLSVHRWKIRAATHESIRSREDRKYVKSPSASLRADEPGLLRKHSMIKSYTTSRFTYPRIRTFYHPHPQADKLPTEPAPLPLLVFVHGLGGSLAQFNSLLTTFVNIAPSLGIDLPGCGRSDFAPTDWRAYSHDAIAELLGTIIDQTCEMSSTRDVVLIAHSMGCSFCVSVATHDQTRAEAKFRVRGVIAICPTATAPTKNQIKLLRVVANAPVSLFNLFRKWDRRGGLNSPSVVRFVGEEAHEDTKKLQLRYNEQSRSEVFLRVAYGGLPDIRQDGFLQGGLPGPEVWGRLTVPVFLIAGQDDRITPPREVEIIAKAMGKEFSSQKSGDIKSTRQNGETRMEAGLSSSESASVTEANRSEHGLQTDSLGPKIKNVLKISIVPSPAAHGMLYDLTTYRTISGLIQTFIAAHIDPRLSLSWQLQHLKESNKWDVKNLTKWQGVVPVSEPIGGAFRAMKTLREVDDVHAPQFFVDRWKDKISAVIDISHDSPVYNPKALDAGGIDYHKFPTVSKVPPTVDEVKEFIALADRLRSSKPDDGRAIGVHCHYGFNRTGFFICCYLIERMGFGVQGALDEFAKGRPPGIRHEHFIDTLFVRYCVGLQRAPTF